MNWVIYAMGAALALAAADLLVKAAAGRIPDSLGMLLYGCVPFATGLAWFVADRARGGPMTVHGPAVAWGLGVGVMFTLVTFAMYAAFRNGAPVSVASPIIRLGGLVVASLAGVLLWKEPLTARYLAGLGLSLAGLYLIMTR